MYYVCNKCHARFDESVPMCDKCGGFSIVFVTNDEASQLFLDKAKKVCKNSSHQETGTVVLAHSKSAKLVYAIGVVVAMIVFFLVFYVMAYVVGMERVPLKFLFPSCFLIILIFFGIGTSMKRDRIFKCPKCNFVNIN